MDEYVLVDSDVWVGFFLEDDFHHELSNRWLSLIREQGWQITVTSAIIGEVATVLSHKSGAEVARTFIDFVRDTDQNGLLSIFIKEAFVETALDVFVDQSNRGVSFVDCANVAIMHHFQFDHICSFDKVYHKKFDLPNLVYEYE